MERETGHLLEAQELLQEAHREDPDNTYVLIEQALVGHELGTTNAEALLHAIEPESPYARHVQGVSAADRGAYEEAEGLFASILQSDPRHLPTLTAWARMALDRGHLRTAADLLTRALQVDPENPHAVHMRAELFELQGKHDEALRMLEDLLAVQQANVKVLVALGTLLAKLHRADEARRRFETALEIDPHNVHALTALAGVALDAGDLGPAEAYIEEALRRTRAGKLSPAAPLNVRAKIVAERSLGRPNPSPAASYALMEESLSIAKTVGMVLGRIKTLNTWVQVALRFQDLHTAVARVQMSRELDPRNAYTLELAAKVFRARGQPGDTDLGEALEQAAQEIRESPAH